MNHRLQTNQWQQELIEYRNAIISDYRSTHEFWAMIWTVKRRSYMSAHVLLNLLNKFEKSDKMQGLPSILSLFCNKFNKVNNSGA